MDVEDDPLDPNMPFLEECPEDHSGLDDEVMDWREETASPHPANPGTARPLGQRQEIKDGEIEYELIDDDEDLATKSRWWRHSSPGQIQMAVVTADIQCAIHATKRCYF